jgi:hypothetical protein
MSTKYAQILLRRFGEPGDPGMQGAIDLAYITIDIISQSSEAPTAAWATVLQAAKDLIKTRSNRSRANLLQSIVEVQRVSSAVGRPEVPNVLGTGLDVREGNFEFRIHNPGSLAKPMEKVSADSVVPEEKKAIIQEDTDYEDREHEFRHRLRSPGTFRRGD